MKKEKFISLTDKELQLLHWCVEHHAPRPAFPTAVLEKGYLPQEDLELKDLEARLATAIELPVSDSEVVLQLVPEHLQDAVKRILGGNDEHVAVAVWCEEDVFGRAKEKRMKISREEAQEILADIDRKQDAELGITWDTIDCYLDELKEGRKKHGNNI